MIKTNRDIPVGAVITTTKGNTLICMVDDAGQRGFFTKSGTWYRASDTAFRFGKNDSGVIDKIQVFDTLPPLDALSEACKLMWNPARPACANLTTIYTREPAEVTAARKALADAKAAADRAAAVIAAYGF